MVSPEPPERLSLREMQDRVGKLAAKVELVTLEVVDGVVRMYQRDGDGWRLLSDGLVCRPGGV